MGGCGVGSRCLILLSSQGARRSLDVDNPADAGPACPAPQPRPRPPAVHATPPPPPSAAAAADVKSPAASALLHYMSGETPCLPSGVVDKPEGAPTAFVADQHFCEVSVLRSLFWFLSVARIRAHTPPNTHTSTFL